MTSGPVLRRARFGRVSDPGLSVGCPGSPGGRVRVPPGGPGGPSEERQPGMREVEAGRGFHLSDRGDSKGELQRVKVSTLGAYILGLQETIDSGVVALDRGPGALL